MKKQIFTILAGLLVSTGGSVQAQQAFEKNKLLLNTGAFITKGSTPLLISAEYGLLNHVGIGLRAYSEYSPGANTVTGSVFTNYHFTPFYKIDPFVGLSAVKTFSSSREGFTINNLHASVQAGARYLFTNRLGAYAQAVIPFKSNVNPGGEVGATLKIGKITR